MLFMKKENRDVRFNELKAQGRSPKKGTAHGSCIHPQYVEDFPDLAIKADNGFGNCHYKTHFPKLYKLEF